ncbi:MAG: NAD-dependent epimerase/dehydratase family protein, partial [Longimicrobiales bacterium]
MASGRAVFITGATGFIGGRLADRFLESGHRLTCLVRTPSAAAQLEARGVHLIEGDITDPVALERGLRDAELAFHLAAIYAFGVVDEAALERTNVDGTQAFLRAIEYAGTPHAVHVSSTAALAPANHRTADVTAAWSGPYPSIYHRTKAQAHRTAREAQRRGLPLVIVCPPNVYGPGDLGPNGGLVRDAVHGRLPGLLRDPAVFDYAYVDDVADALVAAGERGRPGETYILGGDRLD